MTKEEQEESRVQLTCSQAMPYTSNRADCLAFSSSCLLLMCHRHYLFFSKLQFFTWTPFTKREPAGVVSPLSPWSWCRGACSTAGGGPAAPGAAPAEPTQRGGLLLPMTRFPCKLPHGADQLAPELEVYRPEKGPHTQAGEAIGVNFCSELKLQNCL